MNRFERRPQRPAAPGTGGQWAFPEYAASQSQGSEESAFDLRGFLGLIRRRKWTILVTMALGIGLGVLYVSQVERQYTATAAVALDTRQTELLGVGNNFDDTLGVYGIVSTEMEIIRSSNVMLRAAEAVNIPSSPVFDDRPSRLNALLNLVGLGKDTTTDPGVDPDWSELSDAEKRAWAGRLSGYVTVSQRGDYSSVITISVTTPVPADSAAWANAIASAYIDEQVLSKLQSRELATSFLQERVTTLASDVEAIETQIDEAIFNAIDRAGTPEARATLADLRNDLGVLDQQRGMLDNLNVALTSDDLNQLALVADEVNPGVQDERVNLLQTLQVETDEERAAAIRADLAALEDEIRQAAIDRANTLGTQIADAEDQVSDLQVQLNFQVTSQTLPNDVMVGIFELQQDAETTRSLYTNYLTRLRETQQETALVLPDARVISTANTPGSPSYPSIRSTLMMAFLLAGAAGLGLAFVRENLIGGIATPEQMEHVLGIPVVAQVPKHKGRVEPGSAVKDEPFSPFAEAIRRARLGIETFSSEQASTFVVTSAEPNEGKTTIATSLARSLAESGNATILIDADLRRPSVYKLVDSGDEGPVTDYLDEEPGNRPYVVREAATGLYLLLRAKPRDERTDVTILSEEFRAAVEYAKKNFEYIVFDSSPVGLVVDASILAREYADLVLLVLKSDATQQRVAKAAVRDLAMHSEVPIVGVLNQTGGGGGYSRKYRGYYYYGSASRS